MTAPTTIAEVLIVAADRLARLTSDTDDYVLHVSTYNADTIRPKINIQVTSHRRERVDGWGVAEVDYLVALLSLSNAAAMRNGSYAAECTIDGIAWHVWAPVPEEPAEVEPAATQAGAA